jgi:hypothetical protein
VAKENFMIQRIVVILLFVSLVAQPVSALPSIAIPSPVSLTLAESKNWAGRLSQEIPVSYQLVAENETFQLYLNETSLAFKVVDKRSGYIWNSNLDEKAEGDRLNKTWTAFAQSGISIDYLDPGAISERASITNSEVEIRVEKKDQGFESTVTFLVPSITLGVNVILETHGVRVEVPFESIKEENPDFKLGMLHVYPFFAYTRGDSTPGYMFIPDGCGSLIYFSAETKAENMFYGRYYGQDLGMLTSLAYYPMVNRPYNISIPVAGMVHGEQENAYVSIVESGASYGELRAHPSGIITNFNFLYNLFTYNESFFQATNRSGAGVTTLQQETNAYNVVIHYRFLTGEESDYVGMATSYQQYLVEKGILLPLQDPSSDIGIRLEFLGGEKERILFWDRSIPMTTVGQMAEIVAALEVENPEVIYYGWQPLGASSMYPRSFKIDRHLGSSDELASFAESMTSEGGKFYLYLDPQAAIAGESGYSMRYDLAMSITNFNMMGFNRGKENYFLNLDALTDHYANLSEDVFSEIGAGLALDGIGYILYSDFKRDNSLNRENAIDSYQALLVENEGPTTFYTPNDYLFGFIDAYYDIPLTDSGYIYTSATVPFLQIVLAGYVPYYGTALNFSSDIQTDLLRHIDYGVYPSFFLSQEVTANILNTNSSWIYTSSYRQWVNEINRTYQWINELLSPVTGQTITARENLEPGVVATTYANGKQIIVNYNEYPVSLGDAVVSGRNATIREALP